jgi:hypothetical protein
MGAYHCLYIEFCGDRVEYNVDGDWSDCTAAALTIHILELLFYWVQWSIYDEYELFDCFNVCLYFFAGGILLSSGKGEYRLNI